MKNDKYIIDPVELDNIQSICMLCWGRIGDVFLRIPLIESVKLRFPNARIYAVVDSWGFEILNNHPDVFETVIVNRTKTPRLQHIKEMYTMSKKLRQSKIDLCINLYCGGSSAVFSRLINANIRLSFDHSKVLRILNTHLAKYPDFNGHWTYCLGKTLVPLGIDVSTIRLGTSFYTSQESLDKAELMLNKKYRYVVFNLGTGAIEKNWPLTSYIELANKIYNEFNMIPIVLTNPDMPELAIEFNDKIEYCILMPILSFDDIASLLIKTGLLITGDTSIMHLAFGVKTPNLVLFTKTRPEIVQPDDCIHKACFIEDKKSLNYCGLPDGTCDIPLEYAFDCFNKLKKKIDDAPSKKNV